MPRLLEGVAARTPQHREMLLRLAVAGLQAYAAPPPASQLDSEADFAARCAAHACLHCVCYLGRAQPQGPSARPGAQPLVRRQE